jgi:hypothetical protein
VGPHEELVPLLSEGFDGHRFLGMLHRVFRLSVPDKRLGMGLPTPRHGAAKTGGQVRVTIPARDASVKLRPCSECGVPVPDVAGLTHRYTGASPDCWAIFGEVTEREYGDYRYARVHQLTVDAYCVQHPGVPSPQTIQSVAVHLIGFYLRLEHGLRPERVAAACQRAASGKRRFVWLEPLASLGEIVVSYVRDAQDPAEHEERVREWARSAWVAWSPHHETVRRWAAGQALGDDAPPRLRRG